MSHHKIYQNKGEKIKNQPTNKPFFSVFISISTPVTRPFFVFSILTFLSGFIGFLRIAKSEDCNHMKNHTVVTKSEKNKMEDVQMLVHVL